MRPLLSQILKLFSKTIVVEAHTFSRKNKIPWVAILSKNQSFLFLIHKIICLFAVNFIKSDECNHEPAFDPILHRSPCTLTTISDQNDVEQIFVPLPN